MLLRFSGKVVLYCMYLSIVIPDTKLPRRLRFDALSSTNYSLVCMHDAVVFIIVIRFVV